MKKREYSSVSSDDLSTDSKVSDLCKVSLQVMDEGVHIVDSRGRTVFYNTAMANLEGLDPSFVVGRTIQEVFPNLTEETSTLLQVLESQKPIYDYVQTYYTLDGESVTTINSTIPIDVYKRQAINNVYAFVHNLKRHLAQVRNLRVRTQVI